MTSSYVKRFAIAAALAAATSSGVAVAAASTAHSTSKQAPVSTRGPASAKVWTPNDCIRLNHGDFNACNVGNGGRGDLPYPQVGSR